MKTLIQSALWQFFYMSSVSYEEGGGELENVVGEELAGHDRDDTLSRICLHFSITCQCANIPNHDLIYSRIRLSSIHLGIIKR